jgi:hypothetical protein
VVIKPMLVRRSGTRKLRWIFGKRDYTLKPLRGHFE